MEYRPLNGHVSEKGAGIQITYDTLVARDGLEFIFLDYVFDGKHIAGATSTRMRPVAVDEFERRVEEYKDPEYSPLRHIYDEDAQLKSWDEWISDILKHEKHELIVDSSYVGKYGDTVREIVEREGLLDGDIEAVECIGGGRMFGTIEKTEIVLYRPDLWALAKEVEANGLEL